MSAPPTATKPSLGCCRRPLTCGDCSGELYSGEHWERIDEGELPLVEGPGPLPGLHQYTVAGNWIHCCPQPEWCCDCGTDPWTGEPGPYYLRGPAGHEHADRRWSAAVLHASEADR